jgi:hypothetical protein
MPELIHEAVITTVSPAGVVHVAPMGVRYYGDIVVLMPFRPSTTLVNIEATGRAVLNLITDVRVFAGCVTGRKLWPTVALPALPGDRSPTCTADDMHDNMHDNAPDVAPPDQRLACALGHEQLRLVAHSQDEQRPVLRLQRAAAAQHAFFPGMNRAQAAVVEGAVLISRLFMLPREKLESEWRWLQIAIDKTAGPAELEAWGWLDVALRAHLADLAALDQPATP